MITTQNAPIEKLTGSRRVCMLVYSFYESDNRVLRYARALADRGDEVDVIALRSDESLPVFEVLDKVNVYRIQDRARNEKGKFTYLWRMIRFCLKSFFMLARMQSKRRYDLVHVHNVPDFLVFSALVPKLSGARVILDLHDILPEFFANKFKRPENSFYVRLLHKIEKWSARFADHVIVSNHLWLEKITGRSVPPDKCSAFINHVDVDVFNCPRTRQPDGKFIMLYHGGLQRHQGLDLAINAFARVAGQMPGAEFHIYGGGNVKPDLEALVMKLGMEQKVRFFQPMSMKKIAEVVANADLGVVPKRADSFGNEAFSTKIMEYMAEDVPVIVSRTKVDLYYFNDSIVRFFESGNEQQLGEAMVELSKDSGKRTSLARNATDYVALNSWSMKKHNYLQLVDTLLQTRRPQPVGAAQKSTS